MSYDAREILLVEDEQLMAELTEFHLELLGYQVETVTSAPAVHQWLDEKLPSLMILDLAIAGGEGFELLNTLRSDERTAGLRVLVLSTSADLNDVQRAYTAGADDFLVTPFDPAVMEKKIESLLSVAHAH